MKIRNDALVRGTSAFLSITLDAMIAADADGREQDAGRYAMQAATTIAQLRGLRLAEAAQSLIPPAA